MKEQKEIQREGAFILEANMANTLALEGLDCLKQASLFKVGFYYQAFFSLSTALERILKLILIYDYKNKGENLTNATLKKKGHAIKEMVERYAPEILKENSKQLVIEFMTEFAKSTRYYNLDMLTGKEDVDPICVWSLIEVQIVKNYHVEIPVCEDNTIDYQVALTDGTIRSAKPIMEEYERKEIFQEYNVLVFYKIIQTLVDKLVQYQGNETYPNMKEIFKSFQLRLTEEEIRSYKDWRKGNYQFFC